MKRLLVLLGLLAAIPITVAAGEPGLPPCSSVWVTYGQPLNCAPATGQRLHVRYLPSRWSLAEAHVYCASLGGDAAHTRFGNTANVCSDVDPSLLPGGAPSTSSTTSTPSSAPDSTPSSTVTVPASITTTTATTSSTVASPPSTTLPPQPSEFPTPETTGPRDCGTPQVISGSLTTSFHGQVIRCVVIFGNLRIQHNDVLVRDARIVGVATYMIHVRRLGNSASQPCPTGVRVEYTEVDGSQTQANYIPIYAFCGAEFDHVLVHGGGLGFRLVSNSTVTASYVHGARRETPDQHRTAMSMHGGTDNVVRGNTLICERPPDVSSGSGGCSSALSIYGDFAVPDGFIAEGNLLQASGGFCLYGGSGHPDSNQFPEGFNVHITGNHFSTRFNPQCGIFGSMTAWDVFEIANGEPVAFLRGNCRRGNVWHETGVAMFPSDPPCTP